MRYRPLYRRIIVFTTPFINKRTESGLYIPNGRRGTLSSIMRAWVAETSNQLSGKFPQGTVLIAQDGFEFEDFPKNIWPEYEHLPEFAALREFSEKWDAPVQTSILFEASILGIEDDFDASKPPMFETKTWAHFVS